MALLTILGEAPPKSGGAPFRGDAGRRLARLLGVEHARLPELARLRNLLAAWPGKQGKGDAFPIAEARARARRIRVTTPRLVVCGRRVAAALGVRADYLEPATFRGRRAIVLPHPSGVNRWYNCPRNRRRARAALRRMLAA